jgi:hypothetical protein
LTPFTKLERDVMAALSWDLRHIAPDLAGQFGQSVPGARRNTGSGLFTQTLVNTRRPLAAERETGVFGTVHAMVGTLADPVAFQVELLNGRLVALHGDAYGQDTRAIDFAHVPFEQIFTVDGAGRSIPFEDSTDIPAATPAPRLRHFPAAPRPSGAVSTPSTAGAADAAATPDLPTPDDRVSVLIGVWVVIAVAAVLGVLIFGIPMIGAFIVAIWLAAAVRRPRVLSAIQRGLAAWKAARTGQA